MLSLFSIRADKAQARLAAAVAKSVDGKVIRNAVLHVASVRTGIQGTWAAGVADERNGSPMREGTPFISASVGKLGMAAAAFTLAARGLIDLDEPISNWVPAEILRGLPVVGGDAAVHRITVRMLLANRSGLPDYFDGDKHSAKDGAPSLSRLMVLEPERTWNREQLIDYTREHYEPYAAPDESFLYSDLNWDLLGLVFEAATRKPFHAVVRELVLQPAGMGKTWYHVFEHPPEGTEPIADTFSRHTNLVRKPSISLDQAGGGLAGTAEDLGKLMKFLAIDEPGGFQRLGSNWIEDAIHRGLDYGYGAWRWRPGRIFFALSRLPMLFGASGSNNSYAYLTDEGDIITGTMNQTDNPSRHVKFVLAKVLPLLARATTR